MPALLLTSALGFSGYAALLSVAPLWATEQGVSDAGAGLVNGVLLTFTVLAQTAVPRLLRRFGHGPVLSIGVVLLGAPSPLLIWATELPQMLALAAVRGLGFGVLTVTGATVCAYLVPAHRRGTAIGLYGFAVSLPMIALLPASVPLAQGVGFGAVFWLAALPCLAAPAALAIARVLRASGHDRPEERPAPADRRVYASLAAPTATLLAVTVAGGALISFAGRLADPALIGLTLLVFGITQTAGRWGAGVLGDRVAPELPLVPLLLASAAGLGAIAWGVGEGPSWTFPVGGALLGLGYGALQALTLLIAFRRVDEPRVPVASAVWNIGFDAGTALGSVALGLLATWFGFGPGLLGLAALLLVAVAVSPRRTR